MGEPSDNPIGEHDFKTAAPGVYRALLDMGKAVADSGLDKALTEVVKVRASQINGCAYCLQYHVNLARRLGVAIAKLDLVAVWQEAGVFSPREMAALAWTEALCGMANAEIEPEVYRALGGHFAPGEIVNLTAAIATINAWNRIAGALRWPPPVPEENRKPGGA
jgi:AhpD family alkylhydroperoxidase